MRTFATALALGVGFITLAPAVAQASVLLPTGITVSTPAGSNDTTSPYSDDVFMETLSFGSTTFDGSAGIRAIDRFRVTSGASRINAEWGDNDDGSDGDDNPFVKAGFNPALQETTDPAIQNAALLNVFNTLNLSEMSDGEGNGNFSFRVEFSVSLTDDDNGVDAVPEIVFLERGRNDAFEVKLITGGTFDTPVFSNALKVSSRDFWKTGLRVNTTETGAQDVGAGGFDFNDFGIASGASVYGFELTTLNKSGPDLNGFFLTSTDPSRYGKPLSYLTPSTLLAPVPLPAALPLLLAALGGLAVMRRRRG